MRKLGIGITLLTLVAIPLVSQAAHRTRKAKRNPSSDGTVRIVTNNAMYPYNFGANFGCEDPSGYCGFEVELFNAICKSQNLNCVWSQGSAGEYNVPNTMLYNLLNPGSSPAFDMVVSSIASTPLRRPHILFSSNYYTAAAIYIGNRSLHLNMNPAGYPNDVPENMINGRKLRIGALNGLKAETLAANYGSATPQNIELINYFGTPSSDPVADLIAGKIDVYYAWRGIDKSVNYEYCHPANGVANPQCQSPYRVLGAEKQPTDDPLAGVGAAFRPDPQGLQLREIFSDGLIAMRKNGTFQALAKKWLGSDVWNCQTCPVVDGVACPAFPDVND